MKTIFTFLVLTIFIGGGVFFGRRYLPNVKKQEGELKIESQPITTVFINGETKETTPFVQRMLPGQYDIKLIPENQGEFSTFEKSVPVYPSTQTYIWTQLGNSMETSSWEIISLEKIEKNTTEVSINSETDGSEIYFDGAYKGTVPLSFKDVEEGEHDVRLTADGFSEKKITILIRKGYKTTIHTKLALVDMSKLKKQEEKEKPQPSEETSQQIEIDSPVTGWLRVRSKPSKSGEELGKVNDGDKFSILNEDNGWYEIEYEKGKTGWISGSYTKKIEKTQGDEKTSNENKNQ